MWNWRVMRCLFKINRYPMDLTLVSLTQNRVERLCHTDYIMHDDYAISNHDFKLFKRVFHECCLLHKLNWEGSLSSHGHQRRLVAAYYYWKWYPHNAFPHHNLLYYVPKNCLRKKNIPLFLLFIDILQTTLSLHAKPVTLL